MTRVAMEIRFDRSIGDDEEVFETKGVPFDASSVGPQIRQEIEEFAPNFESFEVQSVEMGEPTPDQYLVFAKAVGDFDGATPREVLRNAVEAIQEAYDEGAAGHFDIETIEIDGVTYDTKKLIEADGPAAPAVTP